MLRLSGSTIFASLARWAQWRALRRWAVAPRDRARAAPASMLGQSEDARRRPEGALKTVGRKPRGFESHPLRQLRGAVGGNRSSFGRALWLRGPVVSPSRTAHRRLLSIPSSIT